MTPELYERLEGKRKKISYSQRENDVFSLGMTLLHLGNIQHLNDCYEEKGKFNKDLLNRHVADFEHKYKKESPILCQLVNNLIETEPERRSTANQTLVTLHNSSKLLKERSEN